VTSTDVGYLEALISAGYSRGWIGRHRRDLPFEERVESWRTMCGAGHADKMVLSHDANCLTSTQLPRSDRAKDGPNWHYLHYHNDVIPALKERGVKR